jgi:hypothetical protein
MSTPKKEEHFDVGQTTYETAKKVWSFGKNVAVVNFFLGTAEAVAGKLLDITQGKKLDEVDKESVTPALAKLDDEFLNPVIAKLLTIIMPLYTKAEEVAINVGISALISKLHNQAGLLKREEPEYPTTKPEQKQPASTVQVVVEDAISPSNARRGKTEPARKINPPLVQ